MMETGLIQGFEGPASAIKITARQRSQALHHQFVASGRVVRYAHEHHPQFKMGNMDCFIHVDKYDDGTGTYERRRKDSFVAYQKIIESNGAEGLYILAFCRTSDRPTPRRLISPCSRRVPQVCPWGQAAMSVRRQPIT